MKNFSTPFPEVQTKFLNRLPDAPDHLDGPDQKADKPVDHHAVAQSGFKTVGDNLQSVGKLSPDAAKAVGNRLPQALAGNITNPSDLRGLQSAARDARKNIEDQIPEDNPEDAEANQEYSPEALKAALEWVEEVERAIEQSRQDLAEKLEADPENQELKNGISALNNLSKEVDTVRDAAESGSAALAALAAKQNSVSPLAQKVKAAAEGEVGAANSDAEGNAKYTPGGVDQPWCADFVNHVLEKAGVQGTSSSMAKSFTGGEGKGHVAIGIKNASGGYDSIGGNEGDAVRETAGGGSKFTEHATLDNIGESSGSIESATDDVIVMTKSRESSETSEA